MTTTIPTTTIPTTTMATTAGPSTAIRSTSARSTAAAEPAVRTQRRRFTVTGWVVSGLTAAFMTMDGVMHALRPPVVVDSFAAMGIPIEAAVPMGVIALAIVALYLVPRTAVLGTVLLTSYLGGAVAAHMITQSPLFSSTLFPVYVGIAAWAGTWLRVPAVRALMPVSRRSA